MPEASLCAFLPRAGTRPLRPVAQACRREWRGEHMCRCLRTGVWSGRACGLDYQPTNGMCCCARGFVPVTVTRQSGRVWTREGRVCVLLHRPVHMECRSRGLSNFILRGFDYIYFSSKHLLCGGHAPRFVLGGAGLTLPVQSAQRRCNLLKQNRPA